MKRLMLVIPVMLLAACENPAGTVAGGALIGAAIDDDDRTRGAAAGAAAGVAAAIVEDQLDRQGTCLYRNTRTGETFRAACP